MMSLCSMFLFEFILTFKYFSIIRYSSYSNLSFGKEDLQTMIKEVGEYKNFGGDTLVEVTTCGIKPDFEFLKKVSEATGVNIVCGTGYYLAHTQTEEVKELDIDSLVKVNYFMLKEHGHFFILKKLGSQLQLTINWITSVEVSFVYRR